MDQASLGGVSALDRTTIIVVLSKLEERSLLTRSQSDKDKRSKIVEITHAGRVLVRAVLPYVQQAQERILEPLSSRERKQLQALLKKMAEANNRLSRAPHKLP
jgi:DNA-binding MarR family transcriptional regulator